MHKLHPLWTIQLRQHTWEQELTIAATMMWLAWDLLINFADEVTYLWQGRGKWIKVMYVFIRYVPIIQQGVTLLRFRTLSGYTAVVCRVWSSWNLSFLELLTLAVEIVLVVRVFALYRMNKSLYRIIVVAFIVEVSTMVTILAFVVPRQRFSPQCVSVRSPRLFIGYWLTSLLFESFLFGLTLAKFLDSGVCFLQRARHRSFVYIFMRDGTWAFALIFASMLTSTLMYQLFGSPRAGIGYSLVLSVLSFSGSHVILNIRRLAIPDELVSQQDSGIPLDTRNADVEANTEHVSA